MTLHYDSCKAQNDVSVNTKPRKNGIKSQESDHPKVTLLIPKCDSLT